MRFLVLSGELNLGDVPSSALDDEEEDEERWKECNILRWDNTGEEWIEELEEEDEELSDESSKTYSFWLRLSLTLI